MKNLFSSIPNNWYSILGLFLIILLGSFLRFYDVTESPRGALVDEASIGYNAFSILETGMDEHGVKYPLSFKAFGEEKLPAYIYATVFPTALFGPTVFSVRFISILAGILIIPIIYFLLREFKFTVLESLIGSLITSVAPWTIVLSRFGWESNLALLFFLLGILMFYLGLRKKYIYFLIASGIFFALTFYTYIPYRLIVFLLIPVLLFINRELLSKRQIIIFLITVLFVLTPLIPYVFGSSGTARFKQASVLTDETHALNVISNRTICAGSFPSILCSLLSNKPIEIGYVILQNYATVFSLEYLFIEGEDTKLLGVEKFGLLPIFLIPFFLLGIAAIFQEIKERKVKNITLLILFGLLIASIPVAFTRSPQRVQLSGLYPFILLISLYGLVMLRGIQKFTLFRLTSIFILTVFGGVFILYYIGFHVTKHQGNINYLIPLSSFVDEKKDEVKLVYINRAISDFLIYYAFYTQVNPKEYQKNIILEEQDGYGFQHAAKLGNIKITEDNFKQIVCKHKADENIIYITNEALHVKEPYIGIKPLFIGKSIDGVHGLAFAYKLEDHLPRDESCMGN